MERASVAIAEDDNGMVAMISSYSFAYLRYETPVKINLIGYYSAFAGITFEYKLITGMKRRRMSSNYTEIWPSLVITCERIGGSFSGILN